MERRVEIELIERVIGYAESQTTDMAESMAVLDVSRYTDPARFEAECETIFGTLPRAVGHGSQIPEAGDFFTVDSGHQPLLIVRREDGGLKAFVNVCRHRGARLEWEACGKGRSKFTCRYHGWVYGADGRLKGIPGAQGFPELDRDLHGLKELAVEERYGFIWVQPKLGAELDLDGYLGEIDSDLAGWSMEAHVQYQPQRFSKQINWKLVIDTFLEAYHVKSAHAATIAPLFLTNTGVSDKFGLHQRLVFPKHSILELKDRPQDQWSLRAHANILYVLFPNTMVLVQPDHMAVFHGYPDGIDGVGVDAYTLLPERPETDKARDYWQKNIDILFGALAEDFEIAESVQAGVRSGANEHVTFGRFEQGLGWFNESIEQQITNL